MRSLLLVPLVSLLLVAPAAQAKSFKNCSAMQKTYKGGVAKNKAAQQKAIADGVEYPPTVNAKIYAANASRDRDKDGVACER